MKSLRQQFEEDYTPVAIPKKGGSGTRIRYVYDGLWYVWNLPERELKKKKELIAGCSMGGLLLLLITGIQASGINQSIPVACLGTAALGIHVLELFRIVQFLLSGDRTDRINWNSVNGVLRMIPAARGMCLTLAFAAGWLAACPFTWKGFWVEAGYLACAVLAFLEAFLYRGIPAGTEKNRTMESMGKMR